MKSSRKVVSRSRVIALAAILIAVSGTIVFLRRSAPVREGPPPQPSSGKTSLSNPVTVAARSRALADMAERRFGQAFDFYRALPSSEWQASDCLALAQALFQHDRIGLGRAALEAARRLDPKNQATTAALGSFERDQAAARGPERIALVEVVSAVEPLRSIPDGSTLGLLVVALARYAGSKDQEEEFLDRIRGATWHRLHDSKRRATPSSWLHDCSSKRGEPARHATFSTRWS